VEQTQSSDSIADPGSHPSMSKAELRRLARQRGLLPQLPASQGG
jgi:hypothetical protein